MRDQGRAPLSRRKGHPERYRLVTFEGAFHGRTLGTLAATGSAKYLEGLVRRWTVLTRSRMATSKR
jgi:Ornithine/acetylornithine aminotransferase